jgi:hypothetical protein
MKVGLILVWITGALILGSGEPIHAYPASDTVICRVVYQDALPDGSTEYNGDEITVKVSELPKLPVNPPVKTLVAGFFGLPDFKGTIQDETDKEIITYTGQFTALQAKELFLPHGSPFVLRPQIWFPAKTNDGSPEVYTTPNQNGLRAVWLRTPLWGNDVPPVEARYFAVLVQLYDFASKPVRCHFTGVRTVRAKSFWGGSSTENLTDAETKFVNAPVRKISIYPAISAMHM